MKKPKCQKCGRAKIKTPRAISKIYNIADGFICMECDFAVTETSPEHVRTNWLFARWDGSARRLAEHDKSRDPVGKA